MARTTVVGSLMADESALMAMSTNNRMGYFGSCSKVRSSARWMAFRGPFVGRSMVHQIAMPPETSMR